MTISVIIILVLNILFSAPSVVSSREPRDDDLTFLELVTLVQQQGVTIQQQTALLQTLQAKLTADENAAHQQATTIQQQAALLQTLQAKVTADESTAHQQAATIQQQGVTIQQQAALLQTLQAKVTADETTAHQQAALLQTLQAKLTADESAIHQLQAKQSTMEARQNKNVAFTATFTTGVHNVDLGVHGIVKFNNVITNIGGAYNAATGTFTAPMAGTYAFSFSGQGDNTHTVHIEVNKNGNSILCRTAMEGETGDDWYDKGTCSAVSHLNAGDRVFARHSAFGTYINENPFTSFSGFLVQAD